jgi:hypothetical protein
MAERFDLVTADIGAPDTENPYGTFLDEDAGIPGTPILAGWKNTIKAFMERLMIRTGKTFDGNPDEAAGICQLYDALDEVTTGDDSALAEWAAGTFNQNDVVRYGGKQWFVGVASTIETPGPNSQWCKSKTFDKFLELATEEGAKLGGFNPLDDIRDLTNYAVYYREGKFDWNGGKWEAWAVHIDGSAHTSGTSDVAKLLALSKFSSEVIASDVAGTLTLKDYTGLSERAVDAVAGNSGNVGDRQEDAFQGHNIGLSSTRILASVFSNQTPPSGAADPNRNIVGATDIGVTGETALSAQANATDGTPRTDDETRMMNIAKGVWKLVCIVPEGTI